MRRRKESNSWWSVAFPKAIDPHSQDPCQDLVKNSKNCDKRLSQSNKSLRLRQIQELLGLLNLRETFNSKDSASLKWHKCQVLKPYRETACVRWSKNRCTSRKKAAPSICKPKTMRNHQASKTLTSCKRTWINTRMIIKAACSIMLLGSQSSLRVSIIPIRTSSHQLWTTRVSFFYQFNHFADEYQDLDKVDYLALAQL